MKRLTLLLLVFPAFALSGEPTSRRISIQGTVDDILTDEIDSHSSYLSLKTENQRHYCAVRTETLQQIGPETLIDAEVRIVGTEQEHGTGFRRHMDRLIVLESKDDLRIVTPPAKDPFAVPPLSELRAEKADAIARSGRRRVEGYVKVAWSANSLFVTAADDTDYLVYLQSGLPGFPKQGDFICAVGLPETNLFQINLTRAFWRPADPTFPPPDDPPRAIDPEDLVRAPGRQGPTFRPDGSGKSFRLRGTVRGVPSADSPSEGLFVECGRHTFEFVPANGQRPFTGLTPGSTVEIDCIGVLRTGVWTYTDPLPRVKGYFFVVRDPADVRVLSRPPWWTPGRLLTALLVLFLLLVAFVIRNRILRRIIDRKSRELLREQVSKLRATLRIDERTHLAVELHDSLSQNLSGVACQIAATKGTLPDGADETARHLATAERMLLSCRTELRRCLWDLRGNALEEADFAEAIRRTLDPVVPGVATDIRFAVPRARLSDTTAHAVLCIVRELAANAVRHGQARTLLITGELHGGTLSFSVRDDGCGFDPAACDGPAEGHFGLEGVRERVRRLNGAFTISSRPGRGTCAEVTLALPEQKERDKA